MSYKDFETAIQGSFEKLIKENHHPLPIYNSQKVEDYCNIRMNANKPRLPVDCHKIFSHTIVCNVFKDKLWQG